MRLHAAANADQPSQQAVGGAGNIMAVASADGLEASPELGISWPALLTVVFSNSPAFCTFRCRYELLGGLTAAHSVTICCAEPKAGGSRP
jgi:hypothetical protein